MLIKFNRPSVLGFQDKLLRPGLNDLTAEFVADMQDDSILALKFESGELEIVETDGAKKKKGVETSAADRLASAPENEAKRLTAQTLDPTILNDWMKKEKRVSVKKLIKAQIAKIQNIKFRDKEKDGSKFGKRED